MDASVIDNDSISDQDEKRAKRELNLINQSLLKDNLYYSHNHNNESSETGDSGSDINQSKKRELKTHYERNRKKVEQSKRIENDKKMAAMNVNKKGEQINFKRSIEIRNGIPIRSTDSLYRMTNAITLNYYIVSMIINF